MMVRFATICDYPGCAERSEEYSAFPHCLECMKDFCYNHIEITREADLNTHEVGYCLNCRPMELELIGECDDPNHKILEYIGGEIAKQYKEIK